MKRIVLPRDLIDKLEKVVGRAQAGGLVDSLIADALRRQAEALTTKEQK